MIVKRGTGDLNKIYRPCKINEFVGHEVTKNILKNALEKGTLPHASMFIGPSGCGKTTAARIAALGLNCQHGSTSNPCCECPSCKSILDLNSFAVIELDASRTSDVATVRTVLNDLPASPLSGEKFKVLIIDEAHNLSGKAEDALLKFLEDTPEHVYIILCTNEPQKFKDVTLNRCKTMQFGRLSDDNIYEVLEWVCQFEGYDYKEEVLRYITEKAQGVPRASLSFLQMVSNEGSWTMDAASMIINSGIDIDQAEVFELCKVIFKGNFKNSLATLKKIKNVPIERVRMSICGYFVGCLKRSRSIPEANMFSDIIDYVSEPYFKNPKPEHVLINSIYKITRKLNKRG